jgi:hypothetical protein
MTSKHETAKARRYPGWLWVWGVLIVFFALEAARLS